MNYKTRRLPDAAVPTGQTPVEMMVDALTEFLNEAKEGKFQYLIVMAGKPDGSSESSIVARPEERLEMIGHLEVIKDQLLSELRKA